MKNNEVHSIPMVKRNTVIPTRGYNAGTKCSAFIEFTIGHILTDIKHENQLQ